MKPTGHIGADAFTAISGGETICQTMTPNAQCPDDVALYAIPPGYVLVPVGPTKEMLTAAADWSRDKYGRPVGNDGATGCWKAMLAAAPTTAANCSSADGRNAGESASTSDERMEKS